eukprot:GHVR01080178.1.p1 GENE.GHVR01080178.1~~GHVR01080178.1.p1  ORF type:complete len:152 (+),score=6.99 GHVR01080178.1:292-747(+)
MFIIRLVFGLLFVGGFNFLMVHFVMIHWSICGQCIHVSVVDGDVTLVRVVGLQPDEGCANFVSSHSVVSENPLPHPCCRTTITSISEAARGSSVATQSLRSRGNEIACPEYPRCPPIINRHTTISGRIRDINISSANVMPFNSPGDHIVIR